MATFLDLGAVDFLRFFLPIFTFIFVFVVMYALVDKTGLLGKNKSLNVIFSLIVSLTVLFSGSAVDLINFVTPWFAVIIVIAVLGVLLLSFYLKEGAELKLRFIPTLAMIFAGIVLVVGITQVFGPVFNPYSPDADSNWYALRTLFHPRILGAFLILLVAGLTINRFAPIVKK